MDLRLLAARGVPDQADVLVAVGARRLGDLVAGVGQRLDRDRVAVGPGPSWWETSKSIGLTVTSSSNYGAL